MGPREDGLRNEDELAAVSAAPPLTPRQKRVRLAATLVLLALGVGGLMWTTFRETVPAGGTPAMSGMTMDPGMDHVALELRDVDGSSFEVPGGRPGAVMLMSTRGCGGCVQAARRLADATRARGPFSLTLVSLDTEETKDDFARFDAAAGGIGGRYVLDDAAGSIARALDVFEPGMLVIYDRDGMVRARLDGVHSSARDMAQALGRVG
jgi:hypothetical protein